MINLFHSGGCHDSCCLKVQNVSVKIGGDKILRDVNLHVHCGQMVALIGPNGAGKSTLLKALLGEREFDGNIIFSVPGARRAKARIGYVPQSPNFDPGDPLSVADLFTCCLSRRPAFLGSSKSDRELIHLIEEVRLHDIEAIFVEENGSGSAASIIAAETGAKQAVLSMAMSGEDYFASMYRNIDALKEALK